MIDKEKKLREIGATYGENKFGKFSIIGKKGNIVLIDSELDQAITNKKDTMKYLKYILIGCITFLVSQLNAQETDNYIQFDRYYIVNYNNHIIYYMSLYYLNL